MKKQLNSQLLLLLLATLLISTSGSLGRYIDLPPPVIIWWRSALAAIFLGLYCRFRNIKLKIGSKNDTATFMLSAFFLGIHWITYFYALKLTSVAIAMLSIYTFPMMTALLEPLFFKSKLDNIHIVLGLMVLVGIYFLVPEFDFSGEQTWGVLLGLISALFYSIRNLMLKKHAESYNGTMVMFYQALTLSVILLPVLFFMGTSGIETQYPYVIILALVTTAIGHTLFVKSFRFFRVSTASIIGSLQPIFGIIIAYLFLNETPYWTTFIGGALILMTVVIESLRSASHSKKD